MAKSFAAAVGDWAKQTPQRLEAVRNRAIELLDEEMTRTKPNGGRMPVDTTNLSKSSQASTEGMPKESDGPFTGSNVGLVTATLRLDQAVWLGLQAKYSRVANYGFVGADKLGRVHNRQGNYFVEGAIAQWTQIVAKAAKEVESGAKK